MAHRFTQQELKEIPDEMIITTILNDRLNSLTNIYSPLAMRIKKVMANIYSGDKLCNCGAEPGFHRAYGNCKMLREVK